MTQTDVIHVIRNLDTDELRTTLREAPPPADGRSQEDVISSALEWLDAIQSDLVALISEVGSGDDIDMALAAQYVELTSRWIAFNTKMNYALFKGEQLDANDMYRADAVSALIVHMESLLRPEDINHITDFLAQPLSNAA